MGDSEIPGYSTVTGAAKRTGLHPDTIRYHCRSGNLPGAASATSAGRAWLIPDKALDLFIEERARMGEAEL